MYLHMHVRPSSWNLTPKSGEIGANPGKQGAKMKIPEKRAKLSGLIFGVKCPTPEIAPKPRPARAKMSIPDKMGGGNVSCMVTRFWAQTSKSGCRGRYNGIRSPIEQIWAWFSRFGGSDLLPTPEFALQPPVFRGSSRSGKITCPTKNGGAFHVSVNTECRQRHEQRMDLRPE